MTGELLWAKTSPSSVALDNVRDLVALVAGELRLRWAGGSRRLDQVCDYALAPSGKLLRPVLLLESARAVGGQVHAVLPAAVGAESGHVASLVHDDIIDGDELRRGRPSVQHKYGTDEAIVVGDALLFDLFAGLGACRHTGVAAELVATALEVVAQAGIDLCRGQSLEAELSAERSFDTDAYLTMASLKTAAFFRGVCQVGGILGGGRPEWVAALGVYGDRLGLAFQIHDDLLPYTSGSSVTGKPDTSDLRNARVTLPVILAYNAGTGRHRRAIRLALGASDDLDGNLAGLAAVMAETDAIAQTRQMAHRCVSEALQALDRLPASASRDTLRQFAELTVQRDR
ncbi:polyprenyl synthetase family protein [Kibdelosporangium aridum]|uniref:Polyprenyl synthetase family protein n=1 Tax=Kibdelosporangium aridum TaxID=2030 RepID=A0A428Z534_KIBAR|nr:polyprenyl synthetase family protein [Kibdelosporangium aridum]RSM81924.1 polyprenyl synthetase family protein [Kibdelosporangium aridum]